MERRKTYRYRINPKIININMTKTINIHSKTLYSVGASIKTSAMHARPAYTLHKSESPSWCFVLVLGSGKKGAVFVGGIVVKLAVVAGVVVEDVVPIMIDTEDEDCCLATMYAKAIVGGRR
jgi:hypothetical protein